MLSFVTPWLFGAAVAASLIVAGLHLLSVRTPPPLVLPTARFVPDGEARAVARQPRLNDVLLLVLRVCALLAAGAALAGVRWQRSSASELRLVVAPEALRADTTWRDSLMRALSSDSAMVDVHFARGVSRDAGAALVTAVQRAGELTERHRSLSRVDLTVVLPPRVASRAGFDAWRLQWPGRVRVLSRGADASVPVDTSPADVQVVGGARDDIVAAALATSPPGATRVVRIERGVQAGQRPAGPRSVRATVVAWPVSGVPPGWEPRPTPDTVGALVANGAVLVGPFVRTARLSGAMRARIDSGATASMPSRVIAWWGDGEAAAVEHDGAGGDGCTRSVAVTLPATGDLLLSDEAAGVRAALVSPCGAADALTVSFGRDDALNDALAPASAFRAVRSERVGSDPWWLTPALLAFAVAVLLGEWWWRNREAAV